MSELLDENEREGGSAGGTVLTNLPWLHLTRVPRWSRSRSSAFVQVVIGDYREA